MADCENKWERSFWSDLLDQCEIKVGECADSYNQSVFQHLKRVIHISYKYNNSLNLERMLAKLKGIPLECTAKELEYKICN